jgi:hypothetical protein
MTSNRAAPFVFLLYVAFPFGTALGANVDLQPIDAHIEHWDQMAQGDKSLVPTLKEEWPKARDSLTAGLKARDRRAPSRLVLLMVLQVANPLPATTETGKAWLAYAGAEFPTRDVKGDAVITPWDLYTWWKKHPAPMQDHPLLRKWGDREFSRNTVLPMYESMMRSEGPPVAPR